MKSAVKISSRAFPLVTLTLYVLSHQVVAHSLRPMGCRLPVPPHLPESAQVHVH